MTEETQKTYNTEDLQGLVDYRRGSDI